MIDLNDIPEIAVGGSTAITYTRNAGGRVIAAHCTEPPYGCRTAHSRSRRPANLPAVSAIKRLESLFKPVGVEAVYA